ncbi:DUF1761 domain-containing protein [Aquimarina sp. 2304DJ70-9]|uniref:DUF1761 domain-containing protein n=1 Tax=Aquimarina penaris TaxID=3231044 RepID=UPI0034632C3A
MDLVTAFENINWLSVIVAAISSFLVGGIWYGPVFGKSWMKEFGFKEEDLKKRSIPKTFGLSLFLAFIAALILEMFIGAEADLMFGALAGFFAGFGWVATMLGILYLFEMKSFKAYLINAGYCIVSLTLMGIILGAW